MSLKQIFIINKSLKMDKGKIAAQVGHGAILYMLETCTCTCTSTVHDLKDKNHQMKDDFKEWMKNGLMKKIVLKASQEEMLMIIGTLEAMKDFDDIWFNVVLDKGLTQVPVDSMTCIVFEPLDEKEADTRFRYLKLL